MILQPIIQSRHMPARVRDPPACPKRCGAPLTAIKRRKVSKRLEAREEKIGATFQSGEGRQSGDFLPDRTFRKDFLTLPGRRPHVTQSDIGGV